MTRKTRVCTLDTLDEKLKAAIRAHGAKYGLDDIESDILMCCETITAPYAITPDQGLNITGRYTDKNKVGITFIVLEAEGAGQKFRQVLDESSPVRFRMHMRMQV